MVGRVNMSDFDDEITVWFLFPTNGQPLFPKTLPRTYFSTNHDLFPDTNQTKQQCCQMRKKTLFIFETGADKCCHCARKRTGIRNRFDELCFG